VLGCSFTIPSLTEETRLPPPRGFSRIQCELYLKQPLTPSQRKIFVVYCTSNHILAVENARWLTIPICRDTRPCHFCSYNAVENETHFVLGCPLYNPIRDKFPSLFENVVLGSLKSFFELDHQVDISLYLTKATALCHSRELTGVKPS
jgi:hypothetical protein